VVGGNDVAPELYEAERHPATGPRHDLRDSVEVALLRRALARRMPVLGICRGMQLLNVVRGGTLDQHLADSIDVTPHRPDDATFGLHHVVTAPGSVVARALGERLSVHSHHHQGVDQVGDGLVVTAHAEDGVIEAIEDPDMPFCVGVLWHPDADPDGHGAGVFAALVEAAAVFSGR
jgi:putative glutamine amidotransferase